MFWTLFDLALAIAVVVILGRARIARWWELHQRSRRLSDDELATVMALRSILRTAANARLAMLEEVRGDRRP